MSVFLKSIILSALALSLCACIDVLEKDNDHSDTQGFKIQLTANSWQNEAVPLNGALSQVTWTFSESGTFSELYKFRLASGNFSEANLTGIYEITETISTPSGHLAYKLNITLPDMHNPDLENAPDPLSLIRYDTVYIQDNALYFGLPRLVEPCENGVATDTNEPVYLQYDAISSATAILSALNCYGRPTEIDFDKPYYKLVPTTTQQ